MTDHYIEDKSRLKGQPKQTICDYVASEGFLVPRRFDNLTEARKSKKKVFIRSEHKQEYDGVSGLLDSFSLSNWKYNLKGVKNINDIKRIYFKKEENEQIGKPRLFCRHLNLNYETFKEEISYSFWQKIAGINRKVIADSSIKNRWHILTYYSDSDKKRKIGDYYFLYNYTIAEYGKKTQQFDMKLPNELHQGIDKLIRSYEKIRHLNNFDKNHCPIMEFQTGFNNKNYFLQYHRNRDFMISNFKLLRKPKKNELVVPFVRGATKDKGEKFKVIIHYPYTREKGYLYDEKNANGSYDNHYNGIYSEIASRKRDIQILDSNNSIEELKKIVFKHERISKLFKPRISLIHDFEELRYDHEKVENYFLDQTKNNQIATIDINLISDGRKAYIKRI
jgi:hypothetical protein